MPKPPTPTPKPVIKAIQLTKSFTFGNKIADRLYADDNTQMLEQADCVLLRLNGSLFKIPKHLVVIEYKE